MSVKKGFIKNWKYISKMEEDKEIRKENFSKFIRNHGIKIHEKLSDITDKNDGRDLRIGDYVKYINYNGEFMEPAEILGFYKDKHSGRIYVFLNIYLWMISLDLDKIIKIDIYDKDRSQNV